MSKHLFFTQDQAAFFAKHLQLAESLFAWTQKPSKEYFEIVSGSAVVAGEKYAALTLEELLEFVHNDVIKMYLQMYHPNSYNLIAVQSLAEYLQKMIETDTLIIIDNKIVSRHSSTVVLENF